MSNGNLYRMAAFTETPAGGNPAGVWIGDALPDDQAMQQIAAQVGFSETIFIAPSRGPARTVRYFAPEKEISFCGHATIAAGAVLGGDRSGTAYRLATSVGEVPIMVQRKAGRAEVSLTSVDTSHRSVSAKRLREYLSVLDWHEEDLDLSIPPIVAYAGAWHLVLAAGSAARLAELAYDFNKLQSLMLHDELTTLQLVWREHECLFHSRNPFPVGGVVEDPATGAAAAALAGYLRDAEIIDTPATFEIRQGEAMGRPSLLKVNVPETGGIVVTGTAVEI